MHARLGPYSGGFGTSTAILIPFLQSLRLALAPAAKRAASPGSWNGQSFWIRRSVDKGAYQ